MQESDTRATSNRDAKRDILINAKHMKDVCEREVLGVCVRDRERDREREREAWRESNYPPVISSADIHIAGSS